MQKRSSSAPRRYDLTERDARGVDVSIICPMYNEAAAIADAVEKLRACIDQLAGTAEVLLINDGSEDATVERARQAIGIDGRFRILSHRINFGRGRALRTGFSEARGAIILTTEGDLSWGADVVPRMIAYLHAHPKMDAVFASPHLPDGGYRNVPRHRVWLSTLGNRVLRLLYTGDLTMTTGMTRAYRASVITPHVFTEDGKELHLEISHRLLTLGYHVGEVAAILSWPAAVKGQESRAKRTNWTKISALVVSHLSFGILRGITHVVAPVLLVLTLAVGFFGAWAVYRLLIGEVSIFLAMLTSVLMVLWVNVLMASFMLHQILAVQKEVWRTQFQIGTSAQRPSDAHAAYYFEEPLIDTGVSASAV